ncbi:MAG: NUDIX hydrolase [Candidatus Niyogibacteria bacterium]|nr:NUDIX hydrolase [Candidatus Niyogibacteria bacterium]
MPKKCDHLSVGVLIFDKKGHLLLIERANFPFGFAPVAGHLDGLPARERAKEEALSEVGLEVKRMSDMLEFPLNRNNPCRREGGSHHVWHIYKAAEWEGASSQTAEAKQVIWADRKKLKELADRAELYTKGQITDSAWRANPGLEPVWRDWLSFFKLI